MNQPTAPPCSSCGQPLTLLALEANHRRWVHADPAQDLHCPLRVQPTPDPQWFADAQEEGQA